MSEKQPSPTAGVRYVEVSPPAGWQTMARAVRDIDEDKVQDCKEDIDTLLVFAGLYSAVLSAFNLESYTALQPDPNDQMMYLLERIAVQTQSYTIMSGTVNSTVLPPTPPPSFTAPIWAVRVNGLWFASLIISLATASLSMLVKQWLREYLAIEYTAPQERLRARQYRKPGIEKWKVFEIAAILPMLLQLSLGLFFIGICFFTANIDERMGLTSIPLVSGWAFFFVATALAPAFSPRCPYKTPLLKSMTKLARTHVTAKLRRAVNLIVQYNSLDKAHGAPDGADEEAQVVTGDRDDKNILLFLDTILADDNLIPTMWDALKQHESDPAELLAFVVELIVGRVGPTAQYLRPARLRAIPDLTLLSHRAWHVLMEALANLVDSFYQTGPLVVSSPDWLYKTTFMFLSSSPYPLPTSALQCMRRLLADSLDSTVAKSASLWIARQAEEPQALFHPLSDRLRPLFEHTEEKSYIYAVDYLFAEFLRPYCVRHVAARAQTLFAMLASEPELFVHEAARDVLDDYWRLYHALLRAGSNVTGTGEGFAIVIFFADMMSRRDDAVETLATTWSRNERWCYRALMHAARLHRGHETHDASFTAMVQMSMGAFSRSTNKAAMIANSGKVARRFARGVYDQPRYTAFDMVRFSVLHVHLYIEHSPGHVFTSVADEEASDHDPEADIPGPAAWNILWSDISAALRKYYTDEYWKTLRPGYWLAEPTTLPPDVLLAEDRQLVAQCLAVMGLDTAPEGGHAMPPFPDEFILALGLFIPPERISQYPKLERLQAQMHPGTMQFEVPAVNVYSADEPVVGGEVVVDHEGPPQEDVQQRDRSRRRRHKQRGRVSDDARSDVMIEG